MLTNNVDKNSVVPKYDLEHCQSMSHAHDCLQVLSEFEPKLSELMLFWMFLKTDQNTALFMSTTTDLALKWQKNKLVVWLEPTKLWLHEKNL